MPVMRLFLSVFVLAAASPAAVIEVPGDADAISSALLLAAAGDTVLVHPGNYQDRLITPPQDMVLISEFVISGDSSALFGTVVDATSFAGSDTASVITFDSSNTRATFIGGFTLTGGHGRRNPSNPTSFGGALYTYGGSPTIYACRIVGNQARDYPLMECGFGAPRISHCEIDSNRGDHGLAMFYNTLGDEPVLFEWNDIHDNYGLSGPWLSSHCIVAQWGSMVYRFNRFHDSETWEDIGMWLFESHGEVYGNVFERLTAASLTYIVFANDFGNAFRDNMFRDCVLSDGFCIALDAGGWWNGYRSIVERNWFENVDNGGAGPAGLWMSNPNVEVRENVFINCRAAAGAIQFAQNSGQGCPGVVERNHFFSGRHNDAFEQVGSAFVSVGVGPPCTFSDNWFEGNEGWAIYMDSTITPQADMSNNYWGDPSGPFHPTENPGGLGDSVPANVHVTPWLTEPPGLSNTIKERLSVTPGDWTLEQAYPNPFNAATTLRITSAKPQPFEISAYNILGQKVSSVWQGIVPKNVPVDVRWGGAGDRGGSVASGIYYLVAVPKGPGAGSAKSAKVVLVR